MLQDIAQPDWILRSELEAGLRAVAEARLVFDALALSHQIGVIDELAARHPDLSIVLDHGAKPKLGSKSDMTAWAAGISRLARHANVTCKLSGLLTELQPGGGAADVKQAADILFDQFGPERLLWGSDWPVLTMAGDYESWFTQAHAVVAAHGPQAVAAVMGDNALRIYHPSKRP